MYRSRDSRKESEKLIISWIKLTTLAISRSRFVKGLIVRWKTKNMNELRNDRRGFLVPSAASRFIRERLGNLKIERDLRHCLIPSDFVTQYHARVDICTWPCSNDRDVACRPVGSWTAHVPGSDEPRKSITGPLQTVFFSAGDSDRCVTRDGIIVRQFSLGFIVAVLFKTRSFRKDSRTEINELWHYKAEHLLIVSLLIEHFCSRFFFYFQCRHVCILLSDRHIRRSLVTTLYCQFFLVVLRQQAKCLLERFHGT